MTYTEGLIGERLGEKILVTDSNGVTYQGEAAHISIDLKSYTLRDAESSEGESYDYKWIPEAQAADFLGTCVYIERVALDELEPFPYAPERDPADYADRIEEVEKRGYPNRAPHVAEIDGKYRIFNGHKTVFAYQESGAIESDIMCRVMDYGSWETTMAFVREHLDIEEDFCGCDYISNERALARALTTVNPKEVL